MATKPTDRILDWASGGITTDPGGSKEATGWILNERPPYTWWNWILNSFGQWLSWSEDSIDDIETKTDFITVTQAVDLDDMETDIASLLGTQSYIDTSSSTPSIPDANHIYATATPKVAASISSPSGSPTISGNSIGLSSVSLDGGLFLLTFGRAFNSTDYIAVVTRVGTLDRDFAVTSKTTTTVKVQANRLSDGTYQTAVGQDMFFDIVIIGRH